MEFDGIDPRSTLFQVLLGSFLGILWGVIAEWQRSRDKDEDEDENSDEEEG